MGLFVGGEATAAPPWWVGKGNRGGFTGKFGGRKGGTADGKPERRPGGTGGVSRDGPARQGGGLLLRYCRTVRSLAELLVLKPCAVRVRTDRADGRESWSRSWSRSVVHRLPEESVFHAVHHAREECSPRGARAGPPEK